MKRQIEYTLRNQKGGVATFWMGMGVEGEVNDDVRAGVDQSLVEGGSRYVAAIMAASTLVVVHERGPFDVPDGETGGGDGR